MRHRLYWVMTFFFISACAAPAGVPPTAMPPAAPSATQTKASPYGPEVVAVIPIATAAHGVAVGHGSVWVTGHHSDMLYRVNPDTGEIEAKIKVGQGPGPINIEGDMLWVGDYGTSAETSSLTRVDPTTNEVVVTVKPPDLCCNLAVLDGALWFLDAAGHVHEVDGQSNSLGRSFEVPLMGPAAGNLPTGPGTLWGTGNSNVVWRLDVATGDVVTVTVPAGAPTGNLIGIEGGLLWGVGPGSVWAVDMTTLELAFELRKEDDIARYLEVGAVGEGTLWVAARVNTEGGLKSMLIGFDTVTRTITHRILIGPSPNRVAVGEGAVWVTDFDQSVLLKIVP
jgi:streptogramin lyase